MGVKVENPVDLLNRTDLAIPAVTTRIQDADKEEDSINEVNAINAKVCLYNRQFVLNIRAILCYDLWWLNSFPFDELEIWQEWKTFGNKGFLIQ